MSGDRSWSITACLNFDMNNRKVSCWGRGNLVHRSRLNFQAAPVIRRGVSAKRLFMTLVITKRHWIVEGFGSCEGSPEKGPLAVVRRSIKELADGITKILSHSQLDRTKKAR